MRFAKRKWGYYLTLLDRREFKLKLLVFKKWGELSLQKHNHRGEAWLFLSGGGGICNCEDGFFTGMACSGSYWHIKKGSWHKYQAHKLTFALEIQYGERCEEGDIVRC